MGRELLGGRKVLTGPHAVKILSIPGINVMHLVGVDSEKRARQLGRHGNGGHCSRCSGDESMLSEVEVILRWWWSLCLGLVNWSL